MATDESKAGEPQDPIDAYDSQHGKMNDTIPHVGDDQAWGTSLNPVRETPTPMSNLK